MVAGPTVSVSVSVTVTVTVIVTVTVTVNTMYDNGCGFQVNVN
jgi:hypothetical protein